MEILENNHELTLTKFQTKLRDAGKMPDQDRERVSGREKKKGKREGEFFGSLIFRMNFRLSIRNIQHEFTEERGRELSKDCHKY